MTIQRRDIFAGSADDGQRANYVDGMEPTAERTDVPEFREAQDVTSRIASDDGCGVQLGRGPDRFDASYRQED